MIVDNVGEAFKIFFIILLCLVVYSMPVQAENQDINSENTLSKFMIHNASQPDKAYCKDCHLGEENKIATTTPPISGISRPSPGISRSSDFYSLSGANSSGNSSTLNVIVVPGEYAIHIGPRSWWSFTWWFDRDEVQKVFILVMNSTGVVSGINWTDAGNATIGTWYLPSSGANARYTRTTEGSSGGYIGDWAYSTTQEVSKKNGTYYNIWKWSYAAFPSPGSGVSDSWYDPTDLATYPKSDVIDVNLSIPGYEQVEKNASFLVTPIPCGRMGCHSGHIGSTAICGSEFCDVGGSVNAGCGTCHGNIYMGMWGTGYRTVHPHEVESHRVNLTCSDCHVSQLHGVHNSTALGNDVDGRCVSCHENLTFPNMSGSSITQVNTTIGDYRPSYASHRENVRTYLMNKSNASAFSLTLDWTDPGVDMDLYIFDYSGNLLGGAATLSKPEVYSGSPGTGIYIVKVVWYLDDPPWVPDSSIPENFNLTTDQGYTFKEKPIIDLNGSSWNCSRCHPRPSSPLQSVPTWENDRTNGSYAHADWDADGEPDIKCRFCHNAFHDISTPDCKDCHLGKSEHSSAVNCTLCHGQAVGHTPKYFNTTGGYTSNRSEAGSCSTCHQTSYMDDTLNQSNLSAPKIPSSLNHSNGSKWGSYWNQEAKSCLYCHGSTYHNATALGKVSGAKQSWDYMNGTINATSTWCKDCHYNGSPYYIGDAYSSVPPEISNGSWYGIAGYANHSFSDYNDSRCFTCHNGSLSADVKMDAFMHNVSTGRSGGVDCVNCHDFGKGFSMINVSATNRSIHKDLNNETGTLVNKDNQRCWACHGNGSKPDYDPSAYNNHPANYRSPWNCPDCHTNATGGLNTTTDEGNYSAPAVYEHIHTSGDLATGVSCEYCHNNSVLDSNDPYIPNAKPNVSHYGTKDYLKVGSSSTSTKDCIGCHKESPGESAKWYAVYLPDVGYSRMGTNSANTCWLCHVTTKSMPARSFHGGDLRAPTWRCQNCH